MSSNEQKSGCSEAVDDVQYVADCIAAGRPIPAEVARRVKERADQVRKGILSTHGVQDIGVQIIREIRGEFPES
jgi:hypothetical protein